MPYYILIDLENNIIYKNNYYSVIDNTSQTEYRYETITWFTLLNNTNKQFNLIIRKYNITKYTSNTDLKQQILFINL
jgi:hypothetical protein